MAIMSTTAIKTAMTDNSKSSENNANSKIRNSDYVTRLLALFNCELEGYP
jgi:hypothetical protein